MKILGLIFTLMLVVSSAESKGNSKGEVKKRMIGKNSLMCITFDLLDWKGDFMPSKGIYMDSAGIERKERCGLDGSCGVFTVPSALKMPFFQNNIRYGVTLSVWFKRSKDLRGGLPTIYSYGGCGSAPSEIISLDDKHIMWTIKLATGESTKTFKTESQSRAWRHIVMSVYIDRVTNLGRAVLYFDGIKLGKMRLDMDGGLPGVSGGIHVGGTACTDDRSRYFAGQIDSISVARYSASAREVKQLYDNPGQCVGE